MDISALILALNEEVNLPNCLASLSWCNDIVVLDAFSSDRTEEIASEAGVRFVQNEFDGYAKQRNFALDAIDYSNPWLLMLDADEVVPPAFVEELERVLAYLDEEACLGFFRRKDFFLGTWIKRSSGYPTWFGRLMRIGRVCVSRAINEQYHTDGKTFFLQEHLHHYPFHKGISAWVDKHNRYSSMECELLVNHGPGEIHWPHIFNRDPALRRATMKSIFYRLPARPLWMFLALYVVRGGFLEGRAGLVYCLLRAFYELMIDCKVREARRRKMGMGL